jgi:hypothetical protein
MSRTVTVDELREKLEEIIAEVEAGGEVTVVKEPKEGLSFVNRGVPHPARYIEFAPLHKPLGVSAVDLLVEEREIERSGKRDKR